MQFITAGMTREAAPVEIQKTERNILEAQAAQKPIDHIRSMGQTIRNMNTIMKKENISETLKKEAKNVKNDAVKILKKLQTNYTQKIQTYKQGNQTNNVTRKIRALNNVKRVVNKEIQNLQTREALAFVGNDLENEMEDLESTFGAGSSTSSTMGGKRKSRRSRLTRRLAGRRR